MTLAEMRILFIGARIVGRHCLSAILQSGANVSGLLYLDDAKAKTTVAHADFRPLIETHSLNARSFTSLKGAAGEDHLAWAKSLNPHLGIVVGVSELIEPRLLALPRMGFIGMHPTLLPQGRGRAPIPWAIILGLKSTGVSLFYAAEGADTGDILLQTPVPIYESDTAATLGARTDDAAAAMLVEALPMLASGVAPRIVQDDAQATHWPRRKPEDGIIDWAQPAQKLYDWVRALTHPYPGAFTFSDGRKLFVWSAQPSPQHTGETPGMILEATEDHILVAAANGALKLTDLQWEGCQPSMPSQSGLTRGMQLGAA
jgi:methionyl-tRNA formyltransferase